MAFIDSKFEVDIARGKGMESSESDESDADDDGVKIDEPDGTLL